MATDRERFLIRNTLLSLLKAVEGKETTIELRNENSVSGKVQNVDPYMNVLMNNVVFKSFRGASQKFTSFFVQGPNIRYVHIPDEIDMRAAIDYYANHEWRMKETVKRQIREAANRKITRRQLQEKKEETLKRRQAQLEEKKSSNAENT
uniref:U7 snRNA-associated Sm-like protein LSm10 n=1 Tax=Crassostrea virginica TaxID=6565 RepID=A0A8B8AXM6_CRAVI|nr:U7 snRNA-associated Sm-like protein LSm10 [Crassostrea virginica]